MIGNMDGLTKMLLGDSWGGRKTIYHYIFT